MSRVARATAIALLLAAHASASEPATNVEMLAQAVGEAADALVAAMPEGADPVAVLIAPAESSLARIAIERALLARGIPVAAAADGRAVLAVSVRTARVILPDVRRTLPVGRRLVHRRAEAQLAAELRRADGFVIWTGDRDAAREDWLRPDALPRVEGPADRNCAPSPPVERWTRVVEPMIVMSGVVAVLYLFFTR